MVVSNLMKKTIEDMIAAGHRINGRGNDEFRVPTITTGIVHSANGSAMVDLGQTKVIIGIKPELKEPYPDRPNEGSMATMAELSPMASPEYEPGPPDQSSVELSRVVDRVVRESGMVDFKALCIKEKEKVWNLAFDMYILDMDGNLFDACVMGIVASLKTGSLPVYDAEKDVADFSKSGGPYPLRDTPVGITFAKIGDHIVVDPSVEEENVLDARLTIGVTEKDDVCAMQKGGQSGFTVEEVESLLPRAIEHARRIRGLYP